MPHHITHALRLKRLLFPATALKIIDFVNISYIINVDFATCKTTLTDVVGLNKVMTKIRPNARSLTSWIIALVLTILTNNFTT